MDPNTYAKNVLFLSTPSARRATCFDGTHKNEYQISIHALREEGDNGITKRARPETVFLSTPSARRATYNAMDTQSQTIFLSTPSARRATSP